MKQTLSTEETTEKPEAEADCSAPNCSALPSWFSGQGIPACSMWGKTEIECLAWAYVTGLARAGGDTWEAEITPKDAWNVIEDSEKSWMHEIRNLAGDRPYERYAEWWDMIANQLKSAEGAFEAGGLAWSKFRWQNGESCDP